MGYVPFVLTVTRLLLASMSAAIGIHPLHMAAKEILMSKILLTEVGAPAAAILDDAEVITLTEGQALVRMEAAPVNPVDYLFANGWYAVQPTLPSSIGGEGVGRVLATGSAADEPLMGKRVIVLPTYEQGVWAHLAVISARNLVAIPEHLDAMQASMLAINPLTAHLLLTKYAALQPGDWIGQNIGNSAVARNVIALARVAGVRTLSVVRSEQAAEQVRAIGGDIVLIEGPDLAAQVLDALGDGHLRLVFDGAADHTAGALAPALEPHGTIITYSSTTGELTTLPLGDLVFKGLALRGLWIGQWAHEASREEIEETFTMLAGHVSSGIIHSPVDSTFPLENFRDALDRNASAERAGKVILTFGN
jgi:NADPH:quinone reductase-like Zn-dependent oxidoreductase